MTGTEGLKYQASVTVIHILFVQDFVAMGSSSFNNPHLITLMHSDITLTRSRLELLTSRIGIRSAPDYIFIFRYSSGGNTSHKTIYFRLFV